MAGMPSDFYPAVRSGTISSAEAIIGRLFPDRLTGLTAVDLGAGEGHWSAELARRGASVSALDVAAPKGRVVDVKTVDFEDHDWGLTRPYDDRPPRHPQRELT